MSGFRRPHLKPTRQSPPPQRASQRHRGRHTPRFRAKFPARKFHVEHPTPRLHHRGLAWASSVELGVRRPRRASDAHIRSPHPRHPPTPSKGVTMPSWPYTPPSRRTPPARKFHVEHPTRRPPFTPGVYVGFKRPHRASDALCPGSRHSHSGPSTSTPSGDHGRRNVIVTATHPPSQRTPPRMEVPRGTGWAGMPVTTDTTTKTQQSRRDHLPGPPLPFHVEHQRTAARGEVDASVRGKRSEGRAREISHD